MSRTLRRWCRFGGIALLVAVCVSGICLAHASPPDPTWIGGFYDDADHDDAILAMLAIDGIVVEAFFAIAPVGVVEPLVAGDVAPAPAPHVESPRSRAPPRCPSPA